jgi:hypothetical protein
MSNGLYTNFYNQLMGKTIDLSTDQINVALLDINYVVDLANHTTYAASVTPTGAEIDTGVLVGQTSVGGVFNANNFEFPNVVHGTNARSVVVYHGPSGYLIAFFDQGTTGTINIPCVGNDIHTEWNATGIFAFANCP